MIDFTNLNDVYHLAMIIIGSCSLFLAISVFLHNLQKDKRREKLIKNQLKNKRRK